jgi:hypothetical protein
MSGSPAGGDGAAESFGVTAPLWRPAVERGGRNWPGLGQG